LPEDMVAAEVAAFRKAQLARPADAPSAKKARTDDKAQDTHALAQAIEEKNTRMAAALGIGASGQSALADGGPPLPPGPASLKRLAPA
jgi:hypothetical protein